MKWRRHPAEYSYFAYFDYVLYLENETQKNDNKTKK